MILIRISIFQSTIALIGLVLAVTLNIANGYDYYQHQPVVEVAKIHTPVGFHGPALVNVFGPNKYSYGWGGNSGSSGSHEGGYNDGSSGKSFAMKFTIRR